MKSEALALFNMPLLPLIGLLIFVALFVGIVIWTYHSSNQEKFEASARLPLEDEQ